MAPRRLTYDGSTYLLPDLVADDLEARGVLAPAGEDGEYELSREHLIDEVEPFASSVERSDAPVPPQLGRLRGRDFTITMGPLAIPNLLPTIRRLGPDRDRHRRG